MEENFGPVAEPPSETAFNENGLSIFLGTLSDMGLGAESLQTCMIPLEPFQSHVGNLVGHDTAVEAPKSSGLVDKTMANAEMDALNSKDPLFAPDGLFGFETVPVDHLNELYQHYFMTTHQTFPMINQEAFLSSASTVVNSNDTLALRYAIAAHGTAASLQFTSWAIAGLGFAPDSDYGGWFYQQAKQCLELAENDGPCTSSSLLALQATILIALYELKHAEFSRAWVTTSRAAWLAQALQLHKLDQRYANRRRGSSLTPPPTPDGSTDANEARKTLWAVLELNCLLCVGASSNVLDTMTQNEISIYLPKEDGPEAVCFRLDDVLRKSTPWPLSTHQGLNIATTLCTRTIHHIKRMNYSDPLDRHHYNFWTQHYHLDEAIRYIAHSTSARSIDSMNHSSDNAGCRVILELLLKAIATCLHEALLAKVEVSTKGSLSRTMQVQTSETLTLQNSLDITHLVQTSVSTEAAKTSIFLPWAIYVALQSLVRRQNRGTFTHSRSGRSSSVSTNMSNSSSSTDDMTFNFPSPFANTAPLMTGHLSCSNGSGSLHMLHCSCVRCGTSMDINEPSASSLGSEDVFADTLAEAMVMDSINALRSSLMDLGSKSSLANFFCSEVETEMRDDPIALGERMVGLAVFAEMR